MRRRRPTPPPRPTGFTLIELLVVIVILALLIGLLAPAVLNGVVTARNAAVSSEIQALGQALATFKNQFGDYPPSRLLVCEDGDYSVATVGAGLQPLARRSTQYLRKFWPRMQFNTGATAGAAPGLSAANFYDVNGNLKNDGPNTPTGKPYILTGPECLVLFLGGVPQPMPGTGPYPGSANWAMTGFSKNPSNPFQNSTVTSNRIPPFYEFASNRLGTDLLNTSVPGGFPGFLDSLGSFDITYGAIPFYVYFSAYGGVGYDPGDCDFSETDETTTQPMVGAFIATNAVGSSPFAASAMPGGVQSPAPNPYTNGCPVPTQATNGMIDTSNPRPRVWQQAQSYQIISAGRDRLFGIGGQYNGGTGTRLPFVDASAPGASYVADSFQTMQANAQATGKTLNTDARARERDNLTNFSQSKLD